jgi:hypothetical protein
LEDVETSFGRVEAAKKTQDEGVGDTVDDWGTGWGLGKFYVFDLLQTLVFLV